MTKGALPRPGFPPGDAMGLSASHSGDFSANSKSGCNPQHGWAETEPSVMWMAFQEGEEVSRSPSCQGGTPLPDTPARKPRGAQKAGELLPHEGEGVLEGCPWGAQGCTP